MTSIKKNTINVSSPIIFVSLETSSLFLSAAVHSGTNAATLTVKSSFRLVASETAEGNIQTFKSSPGTPCQTETENKQTSSEPL